MSFFGLGLWDQTNFFFSFERSISKLSEIRKSMNGIQVNYGVPELNGVNNNNHHNTLRNVRVQRSYSYNNNVPSHAGLDAAFALRTSHKKLTRGSGKSPVSINHHRDIPSAAYISMGTADELSGFSSTTRSPTMNRFIFGSLRVSKSPMGLQNSANSAEIFSIAYGTLKKCSYVSNSIGHGI